MSSKPYRPEQLASASEEAKQVISRYEYSLEHFVQHYKSLWEEGEDLYHAYATGQTDDGLLSEFMLPIVFTDIETHLPRIVGANPRVEVGGRRRLEDKLRAAIHREMIFYNWDLFNSNLWLVTYAKAAKVHGIAYGQISYKNEVALREQLVEVPNTLETSFGRIPRIGGGSGPIKEWKLRPTTIYDDAVLDYLDPDQVYPQPGKASVEDMDWLIVRHEAVSLDEIRRLQRGGEGFDKQALSKLEARLKDANAYSPGQSIHTGPGTVSLATRRQDRWGGGSAREPDQTMRQVTLLEHFTPSKRVIVCLEFPDIGALLNQYNRIGEIPIFTYTPIPMFGELVGKSFPEILSAIVFETTTLHRARLDQVYLSAHNLITTLQGSGITREKFHMAKHSPINVRDHGDVLVRPMPSAHPAMYRELDQLRIARQETGGANDTFLGLNTGLTGGTATEASLLQQAAASRALMMFTILGLQALRRKGKLLMKVNERHLSEDKVLSVMGDRVTAEMQQQGLLVGERDPETGEVLVRFNPMEHLYGPTDLWAKIDISQTEPVSREFKFQKGLRALQALQAAGIPPNHPVAEEAMILVMEGAGKDNAEALVEQGREAAFAASQQLQSQASQRPGGATLADQLAVDNSQAALQTAGVA